MPEVKFSHSSLKEFESCALKYYEVRVLKKWPREETQATAYGTQLHEQCELHIKEGRPLDPNFRFLQKTLSSLAAMPGDKYPELEMALTEDLEVCAFDDPNAWVRGIADLVIVNGDTARVWDYKSGSNKYADTSQLELMALMIFKHFPAVTFVSGALLFILKETLAKFKLKAEDAPKIWWRYRERVARIANAHASGVWNPTSSGLCKAHCPCIGCAFNGRN
jgi:hypothetical protein